MIRFKQKKLAQTDLAPHTGKSDTRVEVKTSAGESIRGEVSEIRIDQRPRRVFVTASNLELVNVYGFTIGNAHPKYILRFDDPIFVGQSNSNGEQTLLFKSWGETVTLTTPASPNGA